MLPRRASSNLFPFIQINLFIWMFYSFQSSLLHLSSFQTTIMKLNVQRKHFWIQCGPYLNGSFPSLLLYNQAMRFGGLHCVPIEKIHSDWAPTSSPCIEIGGWRTISYLLSMINITLILCTLHMDYTDYKIITDLINLYIYGISHVKFFKTFRTQMQISRYCYT